MNRHLYGALIVVLLASWVSAPSDAQDKPSGDDGGGLGGQAVPATASGVSEVFRVAKPAPAPERSPQDCSGTP